MASWPPITITLTSQGAKICTAGVHTITVPAGPNVHAESMEVVGRIATSYKRPLTVTAVGPEGAFQMMANPDGSIEDVPTPDSDDTLATPTISSRELLRHEHEPMPEPRPSMTPSLVELSRGDLEGEWMSVLTTSRPTSRQPSKSNLVQESSPSAPQSISSRLGRMIAAFFLRRGARGSLTDGDTSLVNEPAGLGSRNTRSSLHRDDLVSGLVLRTSAEK